MRGGYNYVQKAFYIGILAVIIFTIVSGLCVWKPVQLQAIAWLMGGYEGARLVHFAGMTLICAFIVVHLAFVAIVPSTLLPMFTGRARLAHAIERSRLPCRLKEQLASSGRARRSSISSAACS